MIIQCEQCQTKFKLDDSKVTDKGVKVRCAKCKYVFTVQKDQSKNEPETPFKDVLDSTVTSGTTAISQDISSDFSDAFSNKDEKKRDIDSETDASGFDASSIDFSDSSSTPDADTGDAFSLVPSLDESRNSQGVQADEVDFGAFDFGDDGSVDEVTATPVAAVKAAVEQKPAAHVVSGGLDFSGDDMFGAVVATAPEEPAHDISFDFAMDDFSASLGVEKTNDESEPRNQAADTVDEPFSLGEIDFGDELTSVAVQQVNPEELKPGQDLLFAPLAEQAAAPEIQHDIDFGIPAAESVATPEELPPLSISTRRKQGSAAVVIAVVGLLIVAVLGYFGYSFLKKDKAPVTQDSGRIMIRAVEASFVKNKAIGDLLVIKGEAINGFDKPRAAIQVKGMVYGAKGEVLASKNAFCGNPLTPEQLSTLSLEAIESAMSNQFGDSLTNMEVLPGKSVPFVVVIAKPSADAKDYGVEQAGSTVAAAK